MPTEQEVKEKNRQHEGGWGRITNPSVASTEAIKPKKPVPGTHLDHRYDQPIVIARKKGVIGALFKTPSETSSYDDDLRTKPKSKL